jgi:hypothetical protein
MRSTCPFCYALETGGKYRQPDDARITPEALQGKLFSLPFPGP